MERIEMVEKLRNTANISYEEASNTLERANWDLLGAFILLEQEGTILQSGAYTTRAMGDEPMDDGDKGSWHQRFFAGAANILRVGNANSFVVTKNEEAVLVLSTTVFFLLLLLAFWGMIPIMVVGLFLGYRYSFRGAEFGKDSVNNVMNIVGDTAASIKNEFVNAYNQKRAEEQGEEFEPAQDAEELGEE